MRAGKGKQLRDIDIINYYSSFRRKAVAQKEFRSEFTLRFVFTFCTCTSTEYHEYTL